MALTFAPSSIYGKNTNIVTLPLNFLHDTVQLSATTAAREQRLGPGLKIPSLILS